MSFRHDYYYTVAPMAALLDCPEIRRDFAELLLTEPYIYTNDELIGETSVTDDGHATFVKLLFLSDLKTKYGDSFFGGNAPLTVEFFDKWWTLTKSDAPQNVETVVRILGDAEFNSLVNHLSDAMAHRANRLRSAE
jgi:hypothetical protein